MYYLDIDDHHPACRCGCGQLADECAGPRPNPFGSMTITPAADFDYDYRPTCRWRGCREESYERGLCEIHIATL
jgi:hypothetical protein